MKQKGLTKAYMTQRINVGEMLLSLFFALIIFLSAGLSAPYHIQVGDTLQVSILGLEEDEKNQISLY